MTSLVQPRRERVGLDVGDEAVLVFLRRQLFDGFGGCAHDVLGPDARYALNDVPHPHVLFAFGFWKKKPLLTRFVS